MTVFKIIWYLLCQHFPDYLRYFLVDLFLLGSNRSVCCIWLYRLLKFIKVPTFPLLQQKLSGRCDSALPSVLRFCMLNVVLVDRVIQRDGFFICAPQMVTKFTERVVMPLVMMLEKRLFWTYQETVDWTTIWTVLIILNFY